MEDFAIPGPGVRPLKSLSLAWSLMKREYGRLLLATSLIFFLYFVSTQLQFIGVLPLVFLVGPVYVGVIKVVLVFIDEGEINLSELGFGFRNYALGMIAGMIQTIPTALFALVQAIDTVAQLKHVFTNNPGPDGINDYVSPISEEIFIPGLIIFASFWVFGWLFFYFVYFRIADGEASLGRAFLDSISLVGKNILGLFPLLLIQSVLVVVLSIPCGLGILMLYPWILIASAVAYRSVQPKTQTAL